MIYKVFYDLGCCEGWHYENFDSLDNAIEFAEKQLQSEIVGYINNFPLSDNVNILI